MVRISLAISTPDFQPVGEALRIRKITNWFWPSILQRPGRPRDVEMGQKWQIGLGSPLEVTGVAGKSLAPALVDVPVLNCESVENLSGQRPAECPVRCRSFCDHYCLSMRHDNFFELRLPSTLLDELRVLSEATGLSVAAIIRLAAQQLIDDRRRGRRRASELLRA